MARKMQGWTDGKRKGNTVPIGVDAFEGLATQLLEKRATNRDSHEELLFDPQPKVSATEMQTLPVDEPEEQEYRPLAAFMQRRGIALTC